MKKHKDTIKELAKQEECFEVFMLERISVCEKRITNLDWYFSKENKSIEALKDEVEFLRADNKLLRKVINEKIDGILQYLNRSENGSADKKTIQ